jgi:putative iron-regulated protein
MKKVILRGAVLAASIGLIFSCSNDDDNNNNDSVQEVITQEAVVANYANMMAQNYADNYSTALVLQTKINTFITTPTEAAFNEVKQAWLDAREPYGQSEVARECGTAIDTDESGSTPWGLGSEGQINAWPIDEGYIDYIATGTEAYAGNFTSSIIAGTDTINESLLIGANEGGTGSTDKNISTGWHAIEFLLWGQDETSPSENKTGERTYEDYTTVVNADRRKLYLSTVTNILVNDLKDVSDTWAQGGAFRTYFDSLSTNDAMTIMLTGATFIAGAELSEERMIVPVDNTEGIDNSGQELEHSCFADNTHRDVFTNAQGVFNVVYGRYGQITGPSFYDLVLQEDPTQAAQLQAAYQDAKNKIDAIADNAKPFDQLIVEENTDTTPFGPVMQGAISLKTFSDEISASAQLLGINLN